MKKRIIKVVFTIPFLVVDMITLPLTLIYWIGTGNLLTTLTQQLWES